MAGYVSKRRKIQEERPYKFYRFPRDKTLLQRWISAVNIGNPCSRDRVCNRHFADEDFKLTNLGWKVLTPSAVPTLNLQETKTKGASKKNGIDSNDSTNRLHQPPSKKPRSTHGSSVGAIRKLPVLYSPYWAVRSYPALKASRQSNDDLKAFDEIQRPGRVDNSKSNRSTCPVCFKPCTTRLMLLMHIAVHSSTETVVKESSLSCHVIGKPQGFSRRGVPSQCKPFFCGLCGDTFLLRRDLESHHSQFHHRQGDFICLSCNGKFASVTELEYHVKTVHLFENFICEDCERVFSSNVELRLHLLAHGDVFECPECCTQVENYADLCRHLRSHGRVSFFSCHFCEMLFSSEKIARIHGAAHINAKDDDPFLCYFCGCVPPLKELQEQRYYHSHTIIDGTHEVAAAHSHIQNFQTNRSVSLQSLAFKENVSGTDKSAISVPVSEERSSNGTKHVRNPLRRESENVPCSELSVEVKLEIPEEVIRQSSYVESSSEKRLAGVNSLSSSQQAVVKEEITDTCDKSACEVDHISQQAKLISGEEEQPQDFEGLISKDTVNSNRSCDVNLLKCEDCDKLFSCDNDRQKHKKLHESRGDFSCIECGLQCHSTGALSIHYQDHVKMEDGERWDSDFVFPCQV